MKIYVLCLSVLFVTCANLVGMVPRQSKKGKLSKSAGPKKATVVFSPQAINDRLFKEFLRSIRAEEIGIFDTLLEKVEAADILQKEDSSGKNALRIALDQDKPNSIIVKKLIDKGFDVTKVMHGKSIHELVQSRSKWDSNFKATILPLFTIAQAQSTIEDTFFLNESTITPGNPALNADPEIPIYDTSYLKVSPVSMSNDKNPEYHRSLAKQIKVMVCGILVSCGCAYAINTYLKNKQKRAS